MCSELFRIPVEYNGLPIFGFGVLLAVWLIGGGIATVYVGRQTNWSKETWGYLPGIIIGAIAIVAIPRLFSEGLPIRGYGVTVLIGSIVGIWMAVYRARQVGLNPDVLISLAFSLFICGIVGARLFFVIEYWETRFDKGDWWQSLMEVFKYTEGGLVFYGSIIGGAIAYFVFTRRHQLPALAMADLIVPSVMAGLAFGRIGCLLNGCCYGGETDHPWGVTFPELSIPYVDQVAEGRFLGFQIGPTSEEDARPRVVEVIEGTPAAEAGISADMQLTHVNGTRIQDTKALGQELAMAASVGKTVSLRNAAGARFTLDTELPSRSLPVHPTQIYSSINAGLLAWFLWSFYPFRRKDGQVAALLLTMYPISRFLLEWIRIDEPEVFGTQFSISQNISIVLLLCAAGFWFWLWKQPADKPLHDFTASA